MAHHSANPLLDPAPETQKLGATGQHPEGKLNPDDEGEIAFAIGADRENKKVLIDFGTPVKWIAMNPDQATQFAHILIEKAIEIGGSSDEQQQ